MGTMGPSSVFEGEGGDCGGIVAGGTNFHTLEMAYCETTKDLVL